MKLTHVKGHTWCIEDWEKIPIYITDDHKAIMIDTGLASQREALEKLLSDHGLDLVGILTTHIHLDHDGNHVYFREKYGAEIAVSYGEAGICSSEEMLKAYLFIFTPGFIHDHPEMREQVFLPDRLIMPSDTEITMAGITFSVLHTPGHSPDHVAFMTPDGVLCLGDCLMSGSDFTAARLPYYGFIKRTFETLERLRAVKADAYIVTHGGIYKEIGEEIDQTVCKLQSICDRILAVTEDGMTLDQIYNAVNEDYQTLSSNLYKAALYERNIRAYVEYLADEGKLINYGEHGMVRYRHSASFDFTAQKNMVQ